MSIPTHIQLIHIRVTDLVEAQEFYDQLFDLIGLKEKKKEQGSVTYWGPFGIMLHQQNEVLAHVDHHYRLGPVQFTIRVDSREKVDEIYKCLSDKNYTFEWKPKKFDYTQGYYSTLVFDPDDNKFEFLFDQ